MTDLERYEKLTTEAVSESRGDERQTALRVRSLMTEALARESFLLACTDRILSSIERSGGHWRSPPLYTAPDHSFSIRVFYWQPGRQSDTHAHNAWTVTGVLHNEITVEIFKGATVSGPLPVEPSETFTARVGKTGYLLPPCVHRLQNTSQSDSATLHVFGAEHPRKSQTRPRMSQPVATATTLEYVKGRALSVLCGLVAQIGSPRATEMLHRIFAAGDPAVKLRAIKVLVRRDVDLAYRKSRELEAALQGRDKETLSMINDALASARGQVQTVE